MAKHRLKTPWLKSLASKFWARIWGKSVTSMTQGFQGSGTGFVDNFKTRRAPSPTELLSAFKSVCYAFGSINATTYSSFPPRLFVKTAPQQALPRQRHYTLNTRQVKALREGNPWVDSVIRKDDSIQEILEHPFIDLFRRPNPLQNTTELLELTGFYLETTGICYWYLIFDIFGRPWQIWPFSSDTVTPAPIGASDVPFDPTYPATALAPAYYDVQLQTGSMRIDASQMIVHKCTNPRDPWRGQLSPMEAAWELVLLNAESTSTRLALQENQIRPGGIVSPKAEMGMGQDERERLESELNAKFRRGGMGRWIIGEDNLQFTPLSFPIADSSILAEHGTTKEDLCNIFGLPVSFFTKETNLANLQGSTTLHMTNKIRPMLNSRDERITSYLLPYYDPTGRLFVAAEDPVPEDVAAKREEQRVNLEHAVETINEVRVQDGKPPVPWGNEPIIPAHMAPLSLVIQKMLADIEASKNPKTPSQQDSNRKKPKGEHGNPEKPQG